MNFRQFVQDYFTFNRNERKGITILVVIIFLLAVANKIIFYFETPAKIDTQLLDSLPGQNNLLIHETGNLEAKQKKLFSFNPNTISRESLDSLLLPEGIKRNLLKYREKGGTYYSENDFKKMYGVTDSIFTALKPYLVFENKRKQPTPEKIQSELFTFDPNTATDEDFERLGLSEKQIRTIRNYQNKGGQFRKQTDFLKIYGIPDAQKEALAAYVKIAEKERGDKEKGEKEKEGIRPIEINLTDSIELMRLPGIGKVLSKRIVKYRDLLGGYYSVAQLKEVYGLSEQTILQIENLVVVDSTKVHRVDLNFADWSELSKHPYIQRKLASRIVKFRTRYGSFHDPSVLRDSLILSHEEYKRLKPYL